ncbi:CRISPR-associated ring nuclease Csm6 [Syntrophorhabdus aromaticivorans]|jgi:CRISPR-associated protein Csx14|uniref:CRISPR-associated ring nuclease Csm6 n=1 Tax=Syntrophorhabdus aromaticivorans TaxID=328301 RepID=UPI0004259F90|nr:CRISPR-associated ring nuclease Csm6 [Syntrophorhabdus aromaticivorans]
MHSTEWKEILVFVAGATPQIITETIYALARRQPPVYADSVYIITTSMGKTVIQETLGEKGILRALEEEYGLPAIELTEDTFVLVKDPQGSELADIKDGAHNEALADLITSLIRELSKDPTARLHCSLAGGRKTMSFYMGTALQLFGRPWDKLYHVLVTPEFESNPGFFYKPKKDRVLTHTTPDGNVSRLNTKDAEICLADLPYIRLRDKLSLQGRSFAELVAEGQREIDMATGQPELKLNLLERILSVGGQIIEMVPIQLMFYTIFLRQKVSHCKHPDRPYCLGCTDCYAVLADLSTRPALEDMAQDYAKIYGHNTLRAEELLAKWPHGIGMEIIRQNLSKINRTLKEQIRDQMLIAQCAVSTVRKYGGSRYGVRAEKTKITIE